MWMAVDPASNPEIWLAITYAPRAARPALAALFALDAALGRVVASTTEPMIGAMRLAWWREALEKLHQPPVPAEPVLQALHEAGLAGNAVQAAELAAVTDGWLALIEVEALDRHALDTHARERGERLFTMVGRVLGAVEDRRLRAMGRGWALADLARHISQESVRAEARHAAQQALSEPFPSGLRGARPLIALAALARRDAGAGEAPGRAGSPARQLRMLMALLTGR